jgi:uncharacterized protein
MIIADTGFFTALGNRRDDYHGLALRAMQSLKEPLITTYPVVTEVCQLLRSRVHNSAQVAFMNSIAAGAFSIFELRMQHAARMAMLIEKYEDLPMDMADASLVVLAEALGHGRILTVDQRDFSIYRWDQRNLFENQLID